MEEYRLNRIQEIKKRIFDVIISLIGVIMFSPIMIIIAIIVKLDSKGPVIYKQKRITKNGKEFVIYKFIIHKINYILINLYSLTINHYVIDVILQ